MELKKNDLYWDSANSFPTQNLHFIEVEDDNTKVAMFENGEVDAIEQISSQYFGHLNEYLNSFVAAALCSCGSINRVLVRRPPHC